MNGYGLCLALQSDPGKKRLGCFYKPCYIPLFTERNARFQQPVWQDTNDEVVKHAVYFTPCKRELLRLFYQGLTSRCFSLLQQ